MEISPTKQNYYFLKLVNHVTYAQKHSMRKGNLHKHFGPNHRDRTHSIYIKNLCVQTMLKCNTWAGSHLMDTPWRWTKDTSGEVQIVKMDTLYYVQAILETPVTSVPPCGEVLSNLILFFRFSSIISLSSSLTLSRTIVTVMEINIWIKKNSLTTSTALKMVCSLKQIH